MKRFWIALLLYAVLALLAWKTLTDEKIRLVALAILGMFALRTVLLNQRRKNQVGSERE
jgi:chromate transport protein ChrA